MRMAVTRFKILGDDSASNQRQKTLSSGSTLRTTPVLMREILAESPWRMRLLFDPDPRSPRTESGVMA